MFKRDWELTGFFLVYDLFLISVAFIAALFVKYGNLSAGFYFTSLPVILTSWVIVVVFIANENFLFRESLGERLRGQLLDFFVFAGITSFSLLLLDMTLYSRLVIFGSIGGFFLLRNLGYLFLYRYLAFMRGKGRHVSKILILGAGKLGKRVMEYVEKNPSLGYKVQGFLENRPDSVSVDKNLVLGKVEDLGEILSNTRVDELIIALPVSSTNAIGQALETADYHGLRVKLIPDYYTLFERAFKTSRLGPFSVINLRQIPLDKMDNALIKRVFDILFAIVALTVALLPMVIIAMLIKLTSPGPVFYRPERIGHGGKKFRCWKFRTMRVNESATNNSRSTRPNDPRITSIGGFLRRHSLDELPQFLNVLWNDMSVVGPRPHRTFLNEHMQQQVQGYMLRHFIKPGITGWAQVNGWRGPTDTFEQKSERTKHDLWYIENWSFWLDIRIVFLTVLGKKVKNNAF